MAKRLENIDLVRNVDIFPDPLLNPKEYAAVMETLYSVVWRHDDGRETPIGYMRRHVYDRLMDVPESIRGEIVLDSDKGTVSLFQQGSTYEERTGRAAAVSAHLRASDAFPILRGWRDELWPVYGEGGELLYSMERVALGLLGAMRFGIHMTAFVRCPASSSSHGGLKIWVPRRAADKSSFPGMLDNTVAGGLMTAEDPFECMVREAGEEASLPEAAVRAGAREVGTITYVYVTDARTGEAGYVYPECQWVYDLELPADVVPFPGDGEAESFSLRTVDEVREDMAMGLFKPNCAAVMLDFFIRHGIVTREEEPHYDEILRRLHRVVPFPGPHHGA